MSGELDEDLTFASVLADAADEVAGRGFVAGRPVAHRLKGDGTPVSAVDQEIEEALLDLVLRHRHDEGFLGEEVGAHGTGRRRWLVDGIDGTSEFVAGSPLWSTLIALVDDDAPVLGLSTSTAQQRRWWAATGRGAWTCHLDGGVAGDAVPMAVRRQPVDRLPLAWVEVLPDHPTRPTVERLLHRVEQVDMATHPAFMVAAGELDLAVLAAGGPWDFAALMPMVWEAGGRCLNLEGAETRLPEEPMVFASGMDLHHLRRLLTE